MEKTSLPTSNTMHAPLTYRKVVAETVGTFFLVFAGTGAVVINDVTRGSVTHVGVAFTFGLVVLALIYAIGDVSGCHLNPAVSIGFVVSGRFPARELPAYILSQISGAVLASEVVHLLFPTDLNLGATSPAGSGLQSLLLEFLLTLLLMFVILNVSHGSKESGWQAGVAIGAVIALEALFAGPISGASMNPARSFAPALISGHVEYLWIYCTAPVAGAVAAVILYRVIRGPEACLA